MNVNKKVKIITVFVLVICLIGSYLSMNLYAYDKHSRIPSKGSKPSKMGTANFGWYLADTTFKTVKWKDHKEKVSLDIKIDGSYNQKIKIGGSYKKVIQLCNELGISFKAGARIKCTVARTRYDQIKQKTHIYKYRETYIHRHSDGNFSTRWRYTNKTPKKYYTYKWLKHVYSKWNLD